MVYLSQERINANHLLKLHARIMPSKEQGSVKGIQSSETSADTNKTPDTFEVSSNREFLKQKVLAPQKYFASVGAAFGSIVGKIASPTALGIAFGALGSLVMGPAGIALGSIIGTVAGMTAENKLSLGNIAGGMTGGFIGSLAGKAKASKSSEQIHQKDQNTKFSFKKLFNQLRNSKVTELHPISEQDKKLILENIRPGDVIITNNTLIDVEILEKLVGASPDWVHASFVTEDTNVVEMMPKGYQHSTVETLIEQNNQVMVLRPDYSSDEAREKAIEEVKKFEGSKYDFVFNLGTDHRLYCTEMVYKTLKAADPDINIQPLKTSVGPSIVSAGELIKSDDMLMIASTGSEFKHNFISRYQQL